MKEEIFRKYIEGKTGSEESDLVIDHLVASDKTDGSDKFLSEYWHDCMERKTMKPIKRDFIENVYNKLGINRNLKRRYNLYKSVSFVAATLLLAVVVTTIFLYGNRNNHQEIFTQTINTPYGARTSFDLPDGSKVWLNSGSTLTFPSSFKDERSIELVGEAYLEVKKSKNPFVVSTRHGDIEVLGTSFNVNAYDEDMFQATLVTGMIKISNEEKIYLEPGYQYCKDSSGKGKIVRVNPKFFTSWKDGELIFRNEPFITVVKKLERWYNVKIRIKNKSLNNLKYTGTIRMESFSEVLEVLKITSSIKYSFDEKTRVITLTKME